MNILIALILFVFMLVIYRIVLSVMFESKDFDDTDAEITYKMGVLKGEVLDITHDNNINMSRIKVKDKKGKIQYGFSNQPVDHLEALYKGKGYVEFPVVTEKTKNRIITYS